ncbi:hypothetical protein SAMN04488104_103211 [Algoriphagus faecimaris]|uniref:Uncharacterized protein n=1 Tax=Algoriphagus faecimaris TaxID=686796 RepID=A0A1G6V4G8_9BACT|nr:hypothetical protein [Algoriphagus faecimaris]SDD47877.1 hypothetical protein SAMN04488104_103211 [Algoriphagus faecimaris]
MHKSKTLLILFTLCSSVLKAQDKPKNVSQTSLYQSYIEARALKSPDSLLIKAQELLKQDAQFPFAWVLMGKAYNTKSQMPHPKREVFADSAKIAAQKALELDPESAEVLSFVALLDFLDGHINSSRKHQYRIDTTLELSRGLSFNNLNEGRLTEAYKWSDAALTAYPDAAWALRYHGLNAYTLGFYEEAERCFQKINSTAENIDLDAHYKLAHVYMATDQNEKAIEQYHLFRERRYYAENRMHLSAFLFASQLGMFLGNNEEALEDLSFFLKETHNYWVPPQVFGYQLTTLMAFLQQKAGKNIESNLALSQSQKKAEALLAQENEGYGVQLDLAAVYALEGKDELAMQHLSQAVEKGFRDAEWLKRNPLFESVKETEQFNNILKHIKALIHADVKKINLIRK